MTTADILKQTHALRLQGKIQDSFRIARAALGNPPTDAVDSSDVPSGSPAGTRRSDSLLLWQHQPVLWSNISAGICTLTRRNADDFGFMRQVWSDQDFMRSFHRMAPPLPASDERLRATLQQEYAALIADNRALHWIVRSSGGKAWGLLTLTDIMLGHKRAEVMLGVLPGAPLGLATAAMLVLFQFYFNALKFNKLYSLVFDDNAHSLKGTLHLGFKVEGTLRQEVIDPYSGRFEDLIRTGLLAEEAFSPANRRLMKRLLAQRPGS